MSHSERKKIFIGKNSEMSQEVSFMKQVFHSTEENFEKMELRKIYYTSYQQSFYHELKKLKIALKNTNVIHKKTENSMTLWNLIENYDAIGRSKIFFLKFFLKKDFDFNFFNRIEKLSYS